MKYLWKGKELQTKIGIYAAKIDNLLTGITSRRDYSYIRGVYILAS